jgi:hypothetical protein
MKMSAETIAPWRSLKVLYRVFCDKRAASIHELTAVLTAASAQFVLAAPRSGTGRL